MTPHNKIKVLSHSSFSWSDFGKNPLSGYQDLALKYFSTLSAVLIQQTQFPELVALGFWLRPAHLKEIAKAYLTATYRPMGTAYHICPSNVDVMFVYSWALSALAGNRNIVKVSSQKSVLKDAIIKIASDSLALPPWQNWAKDQVLIEYDRDQDVNQMLSESCDLRIIWGGDQTVQSFRQIPISPMAREVVFADRTSIALLNAEAWLAADDSIRNKAAQGFVNDSLLFFQYACSSPRKVYWVGSKDRIALARKDFWQRTNDTQDAKELPLSVESEKIANIQKMVIQSAQTNSLPNQTAIHLNSEFSGLVTAESSSNSDVEHFKSVGGGFFLEENLSQAKDLELHVHNKIQTCAYFGFSKSEVSGWLSSGLFQSGVDRWVPFGRALDFSPAWDGYDLPLVFSRRVEIL